MLARTLPRLQERIQEFLSRTRIGIDFGEHFGGIAVVRGNEILHAETFLDFHEATLEQRRILRRGRRSRHAKKMRINRLRSWVLRQKLPNGQRLPDPHGVMRDLRYMPQPGVYKQKGVDPRTAPSWIKLAKDGKTDAEGFVRALTLIFQKRGYKWDGDELEGMSDAKLKDFLQTARIPSDDASLASDIRENIDRRRQSPNDPARGRTKVSPEELEAFLQLACERGKRGPLPRRAEHRSVKIEELKAAVEGFTTSQGIPAGQKERWKKQLCGLLNKVLRPARFENRLKTGCAWCGKATPRKAKVREIAYRAAVQNLRARDGFQLRPLNDDEKKIFVGWWTDRSTAPGVDAIVKRIEKLNREQKKMARQFHDLLKNEKPKGRTSLCVDHLKMAAQGKTMKDAGVHLQTIAPRKAPNPCRERRDERVLHRLAQILFKPGAQCEAAWRYGPIQYISLEIPEPDTERTPKGKLTERQEMTLKERLAEETEGCVYKALGGCGGEMDKDHVFPRSLGGPDVRFNLAAACMAHNKEKGSKTPYQWFGDRSGQWQAFEARVQKLKIPERKKKILLNQTDEYPEGDPTPLARVGSRPRQFVVALRKMFEKHGVAPPRLDYHLGEPLVQRIAGRETSHFRLSWCRKPDGSENFPYPKDRSSLANHAQDAAILAAIPPHTWRERTLCQKGERPSRSGEWKERPGLAYLELAPDWPAFYAGREKPLIRILGSYPVNWKTKFADLTFWREPEHDTPRVKRYKLLRDIQRKDFKNIVSDSVGKMVEDIAAEIELGEKDTAVTALARRLAEPAVKQAMLEWDSNPKNDVQKRDKQMKKVWGAETEREIPRAMEELERRYPSLRRLQVSSQKGGTLARVEPEDGPLRKVQIKPASEGVVVWQQPRKKGKPKVNISILRPKPLQKFGLPRVDPPIPPGVTILGQLQRHQIIWLGQDLERLAGFYRVAKCQKTGVTVQPEEAVPAEIARRVNLRLDSKSADEAEGDEKATWTLGKRALTEYFEEKRRPSVR
ncbi:MAG TPA: hypothetical protein VMX16_15215 [Terriglobia bacterium]|nr:hypothetical protein [Terriglobia bacterium]